MQTRVQIVEEALGVKLPKDYTQWLESEGYYNGEYYEVFGYIEDFEDKQSYPCIIGATKKIQDHPLITSDDLLLHYDDYLNVLVVLSCRDGCVYNVDFAYRARIADNFLTWFNRLKEFEKEIGHNHEV